MDPINTFRSEFPVIAGAPWSFAIGLTVIGLLIWTVVRWSKAKEISDLESRLKLRDDEIADYKRKLDGATPDEAHHQIEELRAAIRRLDGPKLTADQAGALAMAAARAPGNLEINCDVGFVQGRAYARALGEAFSAPGWQVYIGNVGGVEDIPKKTLTVSLRPEENRTDQDRAMIAALDAAGLEYECLYDAPMAGAVEMYVSHP